MERLTKRDEFGNADIIGVDSAELQGGLTFHETNRVTNALNKLAEYEELEERGKLPKLPCAVGDTVYEIDELRGLISEFIVKGFSISEYGIFVKWELKSGIYRNLDGFNDSEIGKTVFLAHQEAENKLKEMEEGKV